MGNHAWLERLHENVAGVRRTMQAACARAGRDEQSVRMVAVTKYVGPPVIRALLNLGLTDFGESRVQQLAARAGELGARLDGWPWADDAARPAPESPATAATSAPRWHLIGHLQRNKVKAALEYTRVMHSLDSGRLALEIQRVADVLDARVDALIEVNLAGEASKTGVAPADLPDVLGALPGCPRICLRGLMAMTPLDPVPEQARPYFAAARELLDRLRSEGAVGPQCVHLSMGMSQDYAVAIEEGATLVRVGSALFEGLELPPAGAGSV